MPCKAYFSKRLLALTLSLLWAGGMAQAEEHYWKALGIERPSREIFGADFALPDLNGRKIRLKDFQGHVVFLNFWATWCIPCRAEMPAMEKLHREFKDKGLVILALNFRERPEEIKPFVRELQLTFPILLDRDGKVSDRYQVFGLPTSYLLGRKGEILGTVVGARDWTSEEARALIRALLQPPTKR
ncbi:MAG: TlpA disulfide reductase family protein [Candidatus Methylomirabilales bacterium]